MTRGQGGSLKTSIIVLSSLVAVFTIPLTDATAEPRSVVVTVFPLELLFAQVGGDRLALHTLVPPGASPHTFAPKPSDLVRIAEADLFVSVGGGLDPWATRLLAAAPHPPETLSLEELMADDDDTPFSTDPHHWLDPLAIRDQLVSELVSRLSRFDPQDGAGYRYRGTIFRSRLTALDSEIREILSAAGGTSYVAFHNAWRRFARRYQLEEAAVVQEFAGEEPTPRELARLIEAATQAGVTAILVEPQLDPRLARTIGQAFGVGTQIVDPLGDPDDPERADYLSLLRFNARAFARAMGDASASPGVRSETAQ